MYDIIEEIIDHVWQTTSGNNMQQYIVYICSAMIPLLTVAFIDLIKEIFRRCTRG